jgi:hypothetical protein
MQPGAPKRSLGQNFLVDPNVQRRIVDACGAGAGDPVLEIGPGRGALTTHLIERGVLLTVVELDDVLARELEARFGDSVTVIHADVLSLDLASRLPDWASTHVIGNIPYNITSPLVFHLLEVPRPLDLVLMVQAEVAERLTASPGTKAYGALTVGVRSVAEVRRLFAVSRSRWTRPWCASRHAPSRPPTGEWPKTCGPSPGQPSGGAGNSWPRRSRSTRSTASTGRWSGPCWRRWVSRRPSAPSVWRPSSSSPWRRGWRSSVDDHVSTGLGSYL